jgi:hypothetical protein
MGFLGIKRTKVNASYRVIRCVGMQLAQNGRRSKVVFGLCRDHLGQSPAFLSRHCRENGKSPKRGKEEKWQLVQHVKVRVLLNALNVKELGALEL